MSRTSPPAFRLKLLCVVSVVLAILLCSELAPRAQAMQKGVVPDLTWGSPHTDQAKTAAALRDLRSKWVRLNVNWKDIETSRGSYNEWWVTEYEQAIARARAAGQRVLVMVSTSPGWASSSTNREARPDDPADFARFMEFLTARWKGKGVEAYEIWNEPNHERFWPTGVNPTEYAALLKAAYPAVKAGDPDAKVVFGGTSANDYPFIEATYRAGVKGYFDVMATHPYSCAFGPNTSYKYANGRINKDFFRAYREVRRSMANYGDKKPIWFTEFGWSTTTRDCGVSEADQAKYLRRAFQIAAAHSYLKVGFWYNLRNNYWRNDADDIEARFGLMKTNFSYKPAYHAFRQVRKGLPARIDGTPRRRTRRALPHSR